MARFADITCVKTRQGRLQPAPAMDIWSRRIVGWARRNDPKGCMHHSGHGAQHVSLPPSKTVRERGVRPSMGSISSPWDNTAMGSPMGIVKSECVHARARAAREEAALDIFGYIEAVHNRARTHSALGYMSPVESEEANWPDGEGRPRAA